MTARLIRLVVCLTCPGLAGGCASAPERVSSYKPPVRPDGMILVADGAGGGQHAFTAVAASVHRARLPASVSPFEWTHGVGRGIADMTDVEHSREAGRRMAAAIGRARERSPDTPIYLVGYSAGAHVCLEAARWLGPGSVERIILLAPAVAADYDLRPALAAARLGVDAFVSQRDRLELRLGTDLVGTADGKRGVPAAGRVGFDPPPGSGAGSGLRQHPWSSTVAWTGHDGTHAGSLRPAYLRAYVLPLLDPATARPSDR
ncbi:MAG TPA: alpha/beta hydrolase [Gemmataceae bacterium]|nr:alpha/beta hydrolase [Gemmataceae bacterium]